MEQVLESASDRVVTATVRCFVCHNRVGLEAALVLEAGVVCCRRCWERRDSLPVLHRCGAAVLA
jgi:hypothetical protein